MNGKQVVLVILVLFLIVSVVFIVFYYNPPVTSDTQPPTVVISSPLDNTEVTGMVTVSFTATDQSSIVGYEILIDGSLRRNSNSYQWNTSMETNGIHSITCRAQDAFSNWGFSSISVDINNTLPIIDPPISHNFTDEIKVMTYNIEESGANPDWKEVVKEENADIMILVETGYLDDNSDLLLDQAISEFNAYFTDERPYIGYTAQGISYSTSGEAILSRFPILDFNQIGLVPLDNGTDYDVTHDFIHAEVDLNGTIVHLIGSHLKAQSGEVNEDRREWETEGIINYMDNLGEVPVMYMGDLNSFSPDDTGDLAPQGDLGYGPLTMMLHPEDPTYGQYSSSVHNFTDVFRTLNPTDPGYTYGHQNPIYESRIDFILVNSLLLDKILNSTCGDTAHADTGSDHYSVDVWMGWNSTSTPDEDPPAQVTGLNTTVVNHSSIDLEWNTNTEPDLYRYIVYRNGSEIAQVTTTYYNDTGLLSNTTYSYEVSAKDLSSNEGNKSVTVYATTPEAFPVDLIVINEILPHPDAIYTEEWIELYNPSGVAVNLSGYVLDDLIGGGTGAYTIPLDTIIPAYGFLLFNQSTTGIALNNAGDDVNLIKPDGTTVQDSYTYSSSSDDVSHGRETDGGPTWTTFATPTPGASNSGSGLYLLNHWVLVKDQI
jgi:endonuclease/exonuclease/phosphatase family metal-dependent hydrolase